MKRIVLAGFATVAAAALATPAMSTLTQFAAYSAATGFGSNNFLFNAGTTPTIRAVTTVSGNTISDSSRAVVNFAYAVNGITAVPITAYMTYSLSSSTPKATATNIQSLPITGTITFTPVANSVVGSPLTYTTASNLLTIQLNASATSGATLWRTATNRALSGGTGNVPDYGTDYDPNAVLFSSDFLTFDNTYGTERQSSITFSGDNSMNNNTQFLASSIGTFSSDPAPVADPGTGGVSSVPETTTWAMMMVGFGLVGASLRSSRLRKASLFA